ncbi:hypothetical protein I7I51_07343 [Histoplasma capsulatum]|uniref:Uncharacterized protein n=1 Tax=Ajellomyces capsulatus TaxID=5037 RepID=A0A8A1MJ24_AJECA|nr:hypothetical protein I7I51_07343 [Histoplasma capsulatum]
MTAIPWNTQVSTSTIKSMEDLPHLLDDKHTQAILRRFRGCVRIDLSHLACEDDDVVGSRPLGENAARLIKLFKSVGCDRDDPEHHVPALISNDTLEEALSSSQTTVEALLSGMDPPHLTLGDNVRLRCLQGKSRLQAASHFLDPGDKWWGVKLYLDSQAQLREKYQNEQNFSDGDIYRNLRHYQLKGDAPEVARWWARWEGSTKTRDVKKMQRIKQLCDGFDHLLPYVGLWAPVTVKLFRRALEGRCYDESAYYLGEINRIWSTLFPGTRASLVDGPSVRQVEGLMPSYSLADQGRIRHLMDNNLFPCVTGPNERSILLEGLLQVGGRILSLHTFSQDLIYLEPPARGLKVLLPKKHWGSLKKAMGHIYVAGGDRCRVQLSFDEYADIPVGEHMSRDEAQRMRACLSHNGEDDIQRYNRPRASQLRNDGAYFFVGHVYGCDQPAAQRPTSFAVTREVIFSFFGKEPLYSVFRRWSEYQLHSAIAAEKNDFVKSTGPEVPPTIQPVNNPLTPVQLDPGLDDMEGMEPTPPLAPGFEDFSAPLARKTHISVHRSAGEILKMWYNSPPTSLIVLFLISSRSYYKFIGESVLQLRSTINLLAKDHYFMTLHGHTVRTLPDDHILQEAKDKKLLFVGSNSAPGRGSKEPLGSLNDTTGHITLDDLRLYLSSFDVRTGKRLEVDSDELGQGSKRVRYMREQSQVYPQDEEEL